MERALRLKTLGQLRGRGVFLTIMAIPLFVTVYFLIFLDLDIINEQSRPGAGIPPPAHRSHTGRSFIKTIVKMQRALDDLGYDLSKVIGHRDHIRVRVKMFLEEMNSVDEKDHLMRQELQMVLDQSYFTNYTSIVRQQLLITCNQIDAIQSVIKPKWRNSYSYTEDGLYGFQAVRMVRSRTDLRSCSAMGTSGVGGENSKVCRLYANHLAVRDVLLFQQLQHPAVAKLVGYCIQDMNAGVSYVVNTGKQFTLTEAQTASWEVKLQMLWTLCDLLQYLLTSPLGVVTLNPVTPRSFVVTPAGGLLLWDMSWVVVGDRSCRTSTDCYLNGTKHGIACTKGVCDGYSRLQMMEDARTNFFEPLLQNSPSAALKASKRLLKIMQNEYTTWGAIQTILHKLGAGHPDRDESPPTETPHKQPEEAPTSDSNKDQVWHTGQDSYTYKRVEDTDLPGRYDYACPRSQVTWGCIVAMPTTDSAFRRCSGDPQCRAFIMLSNITSSGWLNVCFKNGYGELVDTSDATLYIKVPQRSMDEDLRMNRGDSWEPEGGEAEPETLQACLKDLISEQEEVRTERERHLMAMLSQEGMTEDLWMQSVTSGTMTSADVTEGRTPLSKSSGAGGSIVLHMGAAVVKAVRLVAREGPTMYHHAHLLFYHLDRLLGLYLTPPSRQHVVTKDELSFLVDRLPDFKDHFSPLIRQESLTGVLTIVPPPGVAPLDRLSITPLSNVTQVLKPLTSQQRNHLEYVILLWLTGTPRHLADMYKVKGVLLHVDATDAFKQGVDTLLPYLYHCQFPRHAISILLALDHQKEPACSLGNQVLYSVQQPGVSVSDLHLHFKGTHQVVLLLNRTSEKLLEIVHTCIKRFGEDNVLYD